MSTGAHRSLVPCGVDLNVGDMRLLVPAATAAFIASAMTLSVPATDPAAAAGPSSASAQVSSARVSSARVSPAVDGANTATANITVVPLRGSFTWPLAPRPAVHRRFEPPASQWSSGHRGADLLAAVGQPVLSGGDGVVAFSGVIAGRGVITVRHSGGLRTTYEPVDERLAPGTLVHRGSSVGVLSPAPGHCVPGHCLHWGAISGHTYRDPLSLLGFGRPILLPLG